MTSDLQSRTRNSLLSNADIDEGSQPSAPHGKGGGSKKNITTTRREEAATPSLNSRSRRSPHRWLKSRSRSRRRKGAAAEREKSEERRPEQRETTFRRLISNSKLSTAPSASPSMASMSSSRRISREALSTLDPSRLVRKPSGGYAHYAHSAAAALSRQVSPRSSGGGGGGGRVAAARSEGGSDYVMPPILQELNRRIEVSWNVRYHPDSGALCTKPLGI